MVPSAPIRTSFPKRLLSFSRLLVHIQYRCRVRRYSGKHETSHIRPFTVGHRKRAVGNRVTLQGRFRHAPGPGHPCQREGRARPADSPLFGVRLADGARCHPRLQRAWPCRSGGQILAAEANTGRLRRGGRRSPAGVAPPLSEGVRPPEELVDALDGGGGCLRGGAHREAGLGGDHPGDSFAGARDTLWQRAKRWITSPDPLYERKKASFASDRLMEVADGNPEWAIGFEDECWWSRVALPALSSFSEGGKPHRMIQQSVAKDDPIPKRSPATGSTCPRSAARCGLGSS